MEANDIIFYIAVLIMSIVVHEVAHGFAADSQGDPTARYAGRLSMNPLRHLDMVGSVLLPIILVVMNAGFIIGWAKPVPYNERNLRNKKYGSAIVASAGILANLGLAILFGLLIRLAVFLGWSAPAFFSIASIIVYINILLALFNLIPIPPLDGSKILFSISGGRMGRFRAVVESMSIPLLLIFIVFLWPLIAPVIRHIFTLFTGASL